MDSFEDDNESNFRQRLWGAAVFVAIMVIVLPLLLDGAGSESQFRRVEKLRQEPPQIVDEDGISRIQSIPQAVSNAPAPVAPQTSTTATRPSTESVKETLRQSRSAAPLTAWVVQAGSFNDQENAIAVRNSLRRSGFASFVRDREAVTDPFKVLVGPMISEKSADDVREKVESLLGRSALVTSYP
ncbi:MAG: SPOR domain-containing protein [Granulosicoccus sp.]